MDLIMNHVEQLRKQKNAQQSDTNGIKEDNQERLLFNQES